MPIGQSVAKSETNHLWISGSSRTVEEIAREAFYAGMNAGDWYGFYDDNDKSVRFDDWLNETRQNMNDDSDNSSLRQRNVQGSG